VTPRQPERRAVPDEVVERFDGVERVLHWINACLFAVVMGTAVCLYVPMVSAYVGRREVVKTIHVYTGLALPVPLLASVAGRWGRRLRADLRRLNRWSAEDRRWMRRRGWRPEGLGGFDLGKFNPGQKLNAAFSAGAVVLMLLTGSMMRWFRPWPLSWRTGATFVHDWVAIGLFSAITGHVLFALGDRDALGSMWRGTIRREWAQRHAPRWLHELDDQARPGTGRSPAEDAPDEEVPVEDAPAEEVALRSSRPIGAAAPGPTREG